MRKKTFFAKDFLGVALFTFSVLSLSQVSEANAGGTPVPMPPAETVLKNWGALPGLHPEPGARPAATNMALPTIKPLDIDWLFAADLAMRSA